ncbi:MAG: RNA methyltransferase [Polyangiaceae bacterium]|nr:RNA methyltransferase [Myxococcales bacterium]MCB9588653.1 RNA methyltransferase [Polyangiaceae bacterium]MCB9605211.1 RNA methyltransferase [Polyangiaceae bacterium]
MSSERPSKQASKQRLVVPVAQRTRFILVGPHYPENVGAAARAMKAMGLSRLVLVRPGRLARPDHPMARKMAVKSLDVLDAAPILETLEEALLGVDFSIATSAKIGNRGAYTLRTGAEELVRLASQGLQLAVVFGNEKSGLSDVESLLCDATLRIPMAAPQPSINLAQACQLVSYELFATALVSCLRSPLQNSPAP